MRTVLLIPPLLAIACSAPPAPREVQIDSQRERVSPAVRDLEREVALASQRVRSLERRVALRTDRSRDGDLQKDAANARGALVHAIVLLASRRAWIQALRGEAHTARRAIGQPEEREAELARASAWMRADSVALDALERLARQTAERLIDLDAQLARPPPLKRTPEPGGPHQTVPNAPKERIVGPCSTPKALLQACATSAPGRPGAAAWPASSARPVRTSET